MVFCEKWECRSINVVFTKNLKKKIKKRCNKTKISILNCFNVILVIRQFTISSIKETWALVNFRCRKFLIFNQTESFLSKPILLCQNPTTWVWKKKYCLFSRKKKILINMNNFDEQMNQSCSLSRLFFLELILLKLVQKRSWT